MEKSSGAMVIRPYSEEFRNLWELVIRPALEELGLEAWDGEAEEASAKIVVREVGRRITRCRVVVGVLTGLSPNVMYEVGLAHAAKKPCVLLLEKDSEAPFDITHIRYLRYSRNNLLEAKRGLVLALTASLAMESMEDDFFPELQLMDGETQAELEYLRRGARPLQVRVEPAFADVFVNDSYIGCGGGSIRLNGALERNTVSASIVGYIEEHRVITSSELERGEVLVELVRVADHAGELSSLLQARVPRWLRERRLTPDNPVLMRAISCYLMYIGEFQDAEGEIRDLLTLAPQWFMSVNQLGFLFGTTSRHDLAESLYQLVVEMRPQHFIGRFNLGCIASLRGEYDQAIKQLEMIAGDAAMTSTIRGTLRSLCHDPDFAGLRHSSRHRVPFDEIESWLFPDLTEAERAVFPNASYYTF